MIVRAVKRFTNEAGLPIRREKTWLCASVTTENVPNTSQTIIEMTPGPGPFVVPGDWDRVYFMSPEGTNIDSWPRNGQGHKKGES